MSQPELGKRVSVQKDNRADSLKGDIIFLPTLTRLITGQDRCSATGKRAQEDKSTLFFTLGAIWHLPS